ncbi:MAG: hypothetical protein R2778_00100 [Saprospiraceae bacterium]
MKCFRQIGWLFVIALYWNNSIAQTSQDSSFLEPEIRKFEIGGYIKDLQAIQFFDFNKQWNLDNLVHVRADARWYPAQNWTVHVGLRNRFLYGASVPFYRLDKSLLDDKNGYFDLSRTLADGESYLLHSTIDRASVDFTQGKWQFTLGRQRINWGLNLVWNPNDIFNAYSYFDFDYEERPGTDALKVQYYLNSTSSAELAIKTGKKSDDVIIAGLYRFTKGSYDFQTIAGLVRGDAMVGTGWSGVLGTAGFNGEISAFMPRKDFQHSRATVTGSIGLNYTFPNSLFLHGSYLLNSQGLVNFDSLSTSLLLENVTAKTLSPARHSVFAEIAYQLTPLIRADLAGILNPSDGSYFVGPFFTFSLSDNLQLLAGGQLFFGKSNSLYGNYGKAVFFRLKWSF